MFSLKYVLLHDNVCENGSKAPCNQSSLAQVALSPRTEPPSRKGQRLGGSPGWSERYEEERNIYMTLYAPCIILQYVYKPTRCTKFCDQTLFSIRCSTCLGLYQSIIRNNFYKLYIVFGIRRYMRYHTSGCCVAIATQQPDISAYTGIYKIRYTAYKSCSR